MPKLTLRQIVNYIPSDVDDDVVNMIASGISIIRDYDDIDLLLSVYTDDRFDHGQINEIISGIRDNLPTDKVILYARPDINMYMMRAVRKMIERDYKYNDIKKIMNTKFDEDQLKQILIGLHNNDPAEAIMIFANQEFSWEQMSEIRKGIENHHSYKQISMYANKSLSWEQIREIVSGINEGLSDAEVMLYADPRFNLGQMQQIHDGYKYLSYNYIKRYANPDLSSQKMRDIKTQILNNTYKV